VTANKTRPRGFRAETADLSERELAEMLEAQLARRRRWCSCGKGLDYRDEDGDRRCSTCNKLRGDG
jgi:predicted adenine nucleotide alpha hydrolase (AANH) superfamily ATPase